MANSTLEGDLTSFRVNEIDKIYGSISIIAGAIGVLGNLAILRILVSHRHSLSAKIFLAIAFNDLMTSLFGALPFSIPRIVGGQSVGVFGNDVLCQMCGVILNVTERYSVFLIAVLSVTRAYALRYPLLRLRQPRTVLFMFGYLILQLLQGFLPLFKGAKYYYDEVYTVCTWTLDDIIKLDEEYILYQVTYYALLLLPFFIPSIFVVISCMCCVLSLTRMASIRSTNESNKARAGMTIVLFTLTYIVLHVPLWVFLVLFVIIDAGKIEMNFLQTAPLYLFVFAAKVSVFINAGLNPIIYLGRGSSLQAGFTEDMRQVRGKLTKISRTLTRNRLSQISGGGEEREHMVVNDNTPRSEETENQPAACSEI